MRSLGITLLGLVLVVVLAMAGLDLYEKAYIPSQKPGTMPFFEINQQLITVNTTRIGSDDPVETAVAVAQIIYPATESENTPGAVVLVNRDRLAEVLVAASRVQHFPVNAPLLYVEENRLPELTRQELLRLGPEGVPADENVQVYLIGTIGDAVRREVEGLGFKTRLIRGADPIALARLADDWTSTQHGDHVNDVVIASLENPEPAIPAAFWNAHMGDGFAYVTAGGIPADTRAILERRMHGPWIYVFGDETVISEEIVRELAQYGQVTRIKGRDAVETSAFFAGFHDEGRDWGAWFWQHARSFGWGIAEAGHNAIFVNLEGPAGWQNALPATTLSHMGKHAPVLVLDAGGVPGPIAGYLEWIKPYASAPQQQLLNHGLVIGGPETISWETQVQLDGMLEAYGPIEAHSGVQVSEGASQ